MQRYFLPLLTLAAYAMFAPAEAQDAAPKEPTAATAPAPTEGAGELLVSPTRVVLEGRKRTADVTLSNKGNKEATYRVSFVNMRMDENGKYTRVEEKDTAKDGEHFAADIVRYSPRQVTLKPGETQTVKIMLRKPDGLANGEYRSHLMLATVPDASFGKDVEAEKPANGQISIKLIPLYGITIPVIVRNGELNADAKITSATVKDNTLNVTLARSGEKSLYGDVIATSGDKVVAQQRGVAVYVPNTSRNIDMELSSHSGPLKVVFREREEDGGKVLAETEVRG